MPTYEGHFLAQNHRFACVVARFNQSVTEQLLEGAMDAFRRHGVKEEAIDVVWVPGSFEIAFAAKKLALSGRYNAIICMGAVIRGETAHFDYVCGPMASGIHQIGMETGVPTLFAVLTTNTIEEAQNRAGLKCGNIGFSYALSALEMANLVSKIPCA